MARARHASAYCLNRSNAPVAPPFIRRSTWGCRRAQQENSDKDNVESYEEPENQQFLPSMSKPETPNTNMPDIESFRITQDTLQTQAMLAARQGEKSADIRHLKKEIIKLRSNLANIVSGQLEDRGSL